jgi:hypothetical protein
MALDHSCQVQRHSYAERKDDVYETPPEGTRALLRNEPMLQQPRRILEPACASGRGIVDPLRAAGHTVCASDLNDFGNPTHFYRRDFLMEHKAPDGTDIICTNPPHKLAEEFIAHALELCPRVIMLLRLSFLEAGTGKARKHILRRKVLDEIRPVRIFVFRRRLEMMHRRGWEGPKASSAMCFAWYVWDREYVGLTTVQRISWERP